MKRRAKRVQTISFGKKFFDSFENKIALKKALNEGFSPRQIAIKFGISHQLVRDELYKGIENEKDFLMRRYDNYSPRQSRQQDINKILLLAEQFKHELEQSSEE